VPWRLADRLKADALPSDPAREIEINVSDTGCGIPRPNLERIFLSPSSPQGAKRHGLGRGGGVGDRRETQTAGIEVESEVGKGTTFRVLLPIGET